MIKILKMLLPLLLLTLPSCKTKSEKETHALYNDCSYARFEPLHKTENKGGFQCGSSYVHGKRYPALIQARPGRISFTVRLSKQPTLTYRFVPGPKNERKVDAFISVESDNARSQEFHAQPNKQTAIDLTPFAGKIVRITFSAQFSRNRLNGNVLWIDPSIRQIVANEYPEQNEAEDFRTRHRNNNLLLVLFDDTNARHLGCYGYPRPTSPTIDALASRGVVWENAISQAPVTVLSTATLLTGMYPLAQDASAATALSDQYKTMPEFFSEAGYQTALFTSNPNASPTFGYGQGFKHIETLYKNRDPFGSKAVIASEFVSPVNSWLDRVRDTRFFAYIHFREPHRPISAPLEFRARFMRNPEQPVPDDESLFRGPNENVKREFISAYDANIAFADAQLAKILSHLRMLGLDKKTIVIVLADHGEALWEHGEFGHYETIYEEALRIPLIIKFPEEEKLNGIRKTDAVATMDLLPTLIDLLNLSRKGLQTNGKSLLPVLLHGHFADNRLILSQTFDGKAYSLRSGGFKFITYSDKKRPDQLFDLSNDPHERNNAIHAYPITAGFFRMKLAKTLAGLNNYRKMTSVKTKKAKIDPEEEQELRALGYIH